MRIPLPAPCILGLAGLLLLAPAAAAQLAGLPVADTRAGPRVRGTIAGVVGRFDGVLVANQPDTLTVADRQGGVRRVPVAAITQLSVSQGRSRRLGAKHGALRGAAVGLALGLVVIASSGTDRLQTDDDSAPERVPAYLAFMSVGGATWGGIIGAIVGAERWHRVDVRR